MQLLPVSISFVILLTTVRLSQAFPPSLLRKDRLMECSQLWGTEPRRTFLGRRRFVDMTSSTIAAAGWTLLAPPSTADRGSEEDLTSKLFNADGSIKDAADIEREAKFRTIAFSWDVSDQLSIAVDGENASGTATGTAVQLSYALPEKWGRSGSALYVDRLEGANVKACNRITIYQAPGKADLKRLEKASTTGIAEALDVTADLAAIKQADLIGGRSAVRNGQKFFEFDMAVAPEKCESSQENLGLGFCPYESIYLLSSTILDDRLYVFALQCDKSEWKRANSDLRVVRSSFTVQRA